MESCLLVAGEKSGEEHALSFFPELARRCPDVRFFGVGGDDLEAHGMELLYHLRDFSSMGFTEVMGKIPFYYRALARLEAEVRRRGTRTAIVVDFQDFNMRLAERLKKRGVNVLYYVAPQAWAWKPHRSAALARNAHTLFTILPFEKDWFGDRGVKQVRAVPHPLMKTYRDELPLIPEKPWGDLRKRLKLLLLPGSRRFEVQGLLPEFIRTVELLRRSLDVEVHLVTVPHIDQAFYRSFERHVDVWYRSEELTAAMRACHVALAASGTVTLSTGLFELPTVVCYKAGLLNEFIFYNFIKYRGPISLTNIIHHRMVFPEFIQGAVDPHRIARVISAWTTDQNLYNELKATLRTTKELLAGESFSVPEYMAQVIHERRTP
jgi:lipid-A-disaccharide synthase